MLEKSFMMRTATTFSWSGEAVDFDTAANKRSFAAAVVAALAAAPNALVATVTVTSASQRPKFMNFHKKSSTQLLTWKRTMFCEL